MIVVVESHADDAFLSLGAHIEEWVKRGERVQIITVYSGTRKRARDAKSYADAVGAEWKGLGVEEAGGGGKCIPRKLPPALLGFFCDLGRNVRIFLPLGVGHPEHKEVRRIAEISISDYSYNNRTFYYLDSPYQIAQKNSEEVTRALSGMEVESYRKSSVRKWRHIPHFKDQSKFFWMNPAEKLQQCFELVVRDRKEGFGTTW